MINDEDDEKEYDLSDEDDEFNNCIRQCPKCGEDMFGRRSDYYDDGFTGNIYKCSHCHETVEEHDKNCTEQDESVIYRFTGKVAGIRVLITDDDVERDAGRYTNIQSIEASRPKKKSIFDWLKRRK